MGTFTFNDASLGTATSFRETNVIFGGAGGLADLHGVLTSDGTVPAPAPPGLPYGTYSGQIQFGSP